MPESIITLPDAKNMIVFETNQHPDFLGLSVNIQEVLRADIPTYLAVADDITPANNTLLFAFFNSNTLSKRVRIQRISALPRAPGANTIVLKVGYITSAPTGGSTANVTLTRMSADFPPEAPTPITDFITAQSLPASPSILANQNAGLGILDLNTTGPLRKVDLFSVIGNGSAIQLRGNTDGIGIQQIAGGAAGKISIEILWTLD